MKLIIDQQKTSETCYLLDCLSLAPLARHTDRQTDRQIQTHTHTHTHTHTMNTIHAARVRMANFHAFTSGVASFLLIITGEETRSVPKTFWTKTMCELILTL